MKTEQMYVDLRRASRISADLLIALGLLMAVGTYLSIDQGYTSFWVVLVSFPAGLFYLTCCAVAFFVWLVKARWARAGASAIKAAAFVLLVGPCLRAGDYVHLALFYPAYRQQIEAQAGNNPPLRFDWGDKALWVTDGLQAETLIYDPTDALAATVKEVRASDKGGFGLATRHLVGHFYVELEFST